MTHVQPQETLKLNAASDPYQTYPTDFSRAAATW
jgi:hypothetical protein